MKKYKLTHGSNAVFTILAACILCFTFIGIMSYIIVSNILMEQCKKDAMEFAHFAALEIDGDKFEQVQSDDNEYAKDIDRIISKYTESKLITYIYTMRKVSDDSLIFVFDADKVNPQSYGTEYPLLEDMKPAFDGEISCDKDISVEDGIEIFSTYAPIYSSDNRVVGIVGCDITIADINGIKTEVKTVVILHVTIFCIIFFVVYSLLSLKMMSKDSLTEIYNYDGLLAKGAKLQKNETISYYTAVLINIKDFKYLSRREGTKSGDLILRQYAHKLKNLLEKSEFVARTGSDNFMVLVHNQNAEVFIDKLDDITVKLDVSGNDETAVFARCGIYSIKPEDTIKEILNNASVALNQARSTMTPDKVWYENKMFNDFVEEKKIISDFRTAINNREFIVYYQPKVDVSDYKLCGAEALVRWAKDGNLIPPFKFIPVFEKDGQIAELDFYVFETVCRNIALWKQQGIVPCKISSNFSKVHLSDPDFADKIISIIKKYNVETKYIEIELTESSGYSNFDALTEFVERMNKEHVSISIDDFGTGFSSLSMLKDINADVVKIDKSFLNESESEDKGTLLKNIIKMIHDLRRTVICEGVETADQLLFLKNSNCMIIQGYLFDKPLPQEEFEKRLVSPDYDSKD